MTSSGSGAGQPSWRAVTSAGLPTANSRCGCINKWPVWITRPQFSHSPRCNTSARTRSALLTLLLDSIRSLIQGLLINSHQRTSSLCRLHSSEDQFVLVSCPSWCVELFRGISRVRRWSPECGYSCWPPRMPRIAIAVVSTWFYSLQCVILGDSTT